jgi:intracellular septation protein
MSALIDFLPILAFFIAYKTLGIWVATGVLMASTALQLAVTWLRTRRVSPMMLWSALLVFAFGAVTLYFHSDLVLMWMPTVLYATLAVAFAASSFSGRPFVERMMSEHLTVDAATWRAANWMWVGFFVLLAGLNLAVAYRYGLNTWAWWKLTKIGIVFLFLLAQVYWLARRAERLAGDST